MEAGAVDMAKNPFMSAYLSTANKMMNTARGKATNEFRREAGRQSARMTNAWLGAFTPKKKRKPKSR